MTTSMVAAPPLTWTIEDDRREALERCSALLAREGFIVSWVPAPSARKGVRTPDLLAASGPRVVRVFVLLDREVDAPRTKARIRAALREGETRVCVSWPLRWRVLSNLARWGLDGASVAGW